MILDEQPYCLIYVDERGINILEFDDMSDMSTHISERRIRWPDFAIIHGEIVKHLISDELDISNISLPTSDQASTTEVLDQAALKELLNA